MSSIPMSAAPARRTEAWFPAQALTSVLFLAGIVCLAAFVIVFVRLDGWTYYRTPLSVRGYVKVHRLLRPSGRAGQLFGIAGMALMVLTLLYALRKKSKMLGKLGSTKAWLEVHIFCGIVGPAFITLHTSFKFNGIVSIAYWSMVLVVLSGFVGRYLFVRIPKTLRGTELTFGEIEVRAAELKGQLYETTLPVRLLKRIEAFEAEALPTAGAARSFLRLVVGDLRVRFRLRALREEIRRSGVEREILHETIALIGERVALLRRIAYLSRTKRLFELWHVFHRPLVYLMLAIAAVHIGLSLYFGYGYLRW